MFGRGRCHLDFEVALYLVYQCISVTLETGRKLSVPARDHIKTSKYIVRWSGTFKVTHKDLTFDQVLIPTTIDTKNHVVELTNDDVRFMNFS
jgi:hypothetical protein